MTYCAQIKNAQPCLDAGRARSVEDETRNAELNSHRNPEWRGDFVSCKFKLNKNLNLNLKTKSSSAMSCVNFTRLLGLL